MFELSTGVTVALLVSGGSVHLLQRPWAPAETDQVIVDFNFGAREFSVETISDQDSDTIKEIEKLQAIYGQVIFDLNDDASEVYANGKTFTTDNVFDGGDKFDRFDTLGLCQGILQIYDEEQDSIIANAVWNNGTLYVPVYTADGGLKTCARNLQLTDESAIAPLSQMIEESSRCFYGSIDGITYDDLTDVLSESGLTIKPLEIAIDASASVELPGLRLACDTTQLWLNG